MRKLLLLSFVIAFVTLSNAQTSEKKWGIGAGVGGYNTLDVNKIGFMPELYLSTYLSPKFDLMLKGDWGLKRAGLENTLDFFNPLLNLRFKLSDESKKFRPYLFAGPGLLKDNSESGLNFDAGLGAKYYFNQATALYFDAGYINGIKTTRAAKEIKENFIKATVGIEFDFGKSKDSDMDGVPDKKDKCPNTPTGVAVDANGCPIDTDGDGVADYIDDCPTEAGLTSLKGCPDRDKDGVADKDDDCPDVFGLASLKGCPDSDGDGVTDANDKCPNTPKGWKVDATGCPFDQDKDGLYDEEDDCPTVAGPKENKGCPVKELTAEEIEAQKMKVEPVYFDFNKSNYISGEKAKIDKLVALLKENSNYKVNISGYTDSKGTDAYNLNLSKRRIAAVLKTITSAKIKKNRIGAQKPMGEADPAASNDTEQGMAKNRRVQFEVFKVK